MTNDSERWRATPKTTATLDFVGHACSVTTATNTGICLCIVVSNVCLSQSSGLGGQLAGPDQVGGGVVSLYLRPGDVVRADSL